MGSSHGSPGGDEASHLLTFLRVPMASLPGPGTPPAWPPPWPGLLPTMDQQWTLIQVGQLRRASPILFCWERGHAQVSRGRACPGWLGLGWRPFLGQERAGRAAETHGRNTGGGNMQFLTSSVICQIPVPGSFQTSCAPSLKLCNNLPSFFSSKTESVFDSFLSLRAS